MRLVQPLTQASSPSMVQSLDAKTASSNKNIPGALAATAGRVAEEAPQAMSSRYNKVGAEARVCSGFAVK